MGANPPVQRGLQNTGGRPAVKICYGVAQLESETWFVIPRKPSESSRLLTADLSEDVGEGDLSADTEAGVTGQLGADKGW